MGTSRSRSDVPGLLCGDAGTQRVDGTGTLAETASRRAP
jgi:hypothetical protein